MKIGMTSRGLTGISSEGNWKLELIGANFRAWLAETGEIQILLLLDSIAHELKNRGRLFPTEIPCFGVFGLHRLSRTGAGVPGVNRGGKNGQGEPRGDL